MRYMAFFFSSRFLSFIVFAISDSPQGSASAAPSVHKREKKSGCHFYELVMVERREKWRNHQTKGLGWWSWGLTRGRLQGSPTPRQMCLGVTSHPQQNESPNRCLTSRPGCHASHTHTSAHQPCKDMQAHGTINYYIRKSGSTRGQTKVLTFTLMWLWPEIIRERFDRIYRNVFVPQSLKNNVFSDTLWDLWLLPAENNPSLWKDKIRKYQDIPAPACLVPFNSTNMAW